MKRNRLVITVALAATAAWLVAHLRSSSGTADLDAARARVDAECAAYRSDPALADADVCRFDEHAQVMAHFGRGKDDLAEATRLATRDPVAARIAVRRALATSQELQRHATLLAAATAAALVDRTLDLLDAHPAELDRDLLAGVSLDLALRSLEAERLQLLWTLAHGELDPQHAPSDTAAAEAIATDDAVYRDLEHAARARDTATCERAAGRFVSSPGPHPCAVYAELLAKADRLARYTH